MVERRHGENVLIGKHTPQVGNDFSWVVVGNVGRPTGSNPFGSVHQNHWNDRDIVLRLDRGAVVLQVIEELVVVGMKDGPCDGFQFGKNVTSRGSVLTSHATGPKLSRGRQEIDVVATTVVACHDDNRSL